MFKYDRNKNMFNTSPYDLTIDDILIEPSNNPFESRSEIIEDTRYIYTAPMDKVTNMSIWLKAIRETSVVQPVLSRQYLDDFRGWISKNAEDTINCINTGWISIGTSQEDMDDLRNIILALKFKYSEFKSMKILIDIACGDSNLGMKTIDNIKWTCQKEHVEPYIMSGSICTPGAALNMILSGVTHLRVGIGNGNLCSTRLMTGIGIPNATAIWNIYDLFKNLCKQDDSIIMPEIIADGGIRFPGDVAKYLACGASGVMIGTAFAGCIDSPAEIVDGMKVQRGQASYDFQMEHYGNIRNSCSEGVTRHIPIDMPFVEKVDWFRGGIRSACSYTGNAFISDLTPETTILRRVSPTTMSRESQPIGSWLSSDR